MTPASKARRSLVIGATALLLEVDIDFWRVRQYEVSLAAMVF
jgi:hypothetical protein